MLRLVIFGLVAVLLGLIAGILLNIFTSRTTEIQVQRRGPSEVAIETPIRQPPKPKPTTDEKPAPVVTPASPPAPQPAPTSPPVIDPTPMRTKVATTRARRTKDAQVVATREKQRIRHARHRYDRDDDER